MPASPLIPIRPTIQAGANGPEAAHVKSAGTCAPQAAATAVTQA